ncbi:hypothetical protein [Sphingomonas jatrophae]|uniref:Uncharacterized protein n=1 Tax=Sphingomonas jatrophae TaxID=1166337 RepID=A0A1I6K7A2_9SPHN|nr:hypothetical protein [Sphingomonas jatrophae]SFR87109.1 hypothetical protein SAMN05192580_1406 [Sphingomonas jatrophae]
MTDTTLFIADRATLDSAAELLARFGDHAAIEAALRAGASRDKGNVVHFCRWRQVERLIEVLAADQPVGTVH